MRKTLVFFFSVVFYLHLEAQKRCGLKIQTKEEIEIFENWLSEKKRESGSNKITARSTQLYTVPVVFHIVHQGEEIGQGTNISDDKIIEQVRIMNEDFQRKNPDKINTPTQFQSIAADIGIQFVLAKQSPDRKKTNGIVRVKGDEVIYTLDSDKNRYYEKKLKNLSYWDSEHYLNIWVANIDIIGIATFPVTHLEGITDYSEDDEKLDGIVIKYNYVGNSFVDGFKDSSGRTATHELGHFFGLRHIWGDGHCEKDDYCDDTPPASQNHRELNSCLYPGPNSCNETPDLSDMFMNYMDYTKDECMNMFSLDQKTRMIMVLENSPRRKSLLTSYGLYPINSFDRDIAIEKKSNPYFTVVTHQKTIPIPFTIQNYGKNTIHSFTLSLTNHTTAQTQKIQFENVNISTNETYDLTVQYNGYTAEKTKFTLKVQDINGLSDQYPQNDRIDNTLILDDSRMQVPFKEKFDKGHWLTLNPNDGEMGKWENINNRAEINAFKKYYYKKYWLISPVFSLKGYAEAGLNFKLSYRNASVSDSLKIYMDTTGNGTKELIWNENLATLFEKNKEEWKPTNESDWKNFFIDISKYIKNENLRLIFEFDSRGGNNIYLDDIEIANYTNQKNKPSEGSFLLYPNPVKNILNLVVNLPETQDIEVHLINSKGKVVQEKKYQNIINHKITFDLKNELGLFYVRIKGKNINEVKKLLISN